MSENPPAFPLPSVAISMSLRDWFAGQALVTLAGLHHGNDWGPEGKGHPSACARKAYTIADAMLSARSAPSPSVVEGGR